MKEIKLTNSDKVAIVDDEDYDLVNQYQWCLDTLGYAHLYGNGQDITMHRLILGILGPK